jgi:hypothetical protein
MSSAAPVALTFEYGLVNDFLLEYNTKKKDFADGTISASDYFEWNITLQHAKDPQKKLYTKHVISHKKSVIFLFIE